MPLREIDEKQKKEKVRRGFLSRRLILINCLIKAQHQHTRFPACSPSIKVPSTDSTLADPSGRNTPYQGQMTSASGLEVTSSCFPEM